MIKEGWEAVIGMEIHAQLATNTKIFCGCEVVTGGEPNSYTCPVCLGLPGALPVLNRRVVELGARAALALGLEVQETSIFARKNYFYPDLPKGYQISQYDRPFSANGTLTIMTSERDDQGRPVEWKPMTIRIERMHLEEDAGKNVHDGLPDVDKYSYVDLNRAGTPLGEIVTAPDFRSSWQAYDYVNHVRGALRWVGASDADMEKGNLRCEANVSVRKIGEESFRNKSELKNLNSVRFMQKAIEFEIARQIEAHEKGEAVNQETRLWDEKNQCTRVMRSKEDAHDYRYFPEPDLQPLTVSADFIEGVRKAMPELPAAMRDRFVSNGLSFEDAQHFTANERIARDYDEMARQVGTRDAAIWMKSVRLAQRIQPTSVPSGEAFGNPTVSTTQKIQPASVEPAETVGLPTVSFDDLVYVINSVNKGMLNRGQAKEVFEAIDSDGKSAEAVIEERGLVQVSDTAEIEKIVDEVIAANEKSVEAYRAGSEKLFGFLVGQVMKASQGKANPKLVNEILKKKL